MAFTTWFVMVKKKRNEVLLAIHKQNKQLIKHVRHQSLNHNLLRLVVRV
jgi:hypothetical protein